MTEQDVATQALRDTLHTQTKDAIVAILKQHKAEHGTTDIDRVGIVAALVQFCMFIAGNGKFVVGADTDALLHFGIDVVSGAAVAAKTEVEERRIILV